MESQRETDIYMRTCGPRAEPNTAAVVVYIHFARVVTIYSYIRFACF